MHTNKWDFLDPLKTTTDAVSIEAVSKAIDCREDGKAERKR
jgi:hypothetical protein